MIGDVWARPRFCDPVLGDEARIAWLQTTLRQYLAMSTDCAGGVWWLPLAKS
jgi:hypothetical protein